MAAQRDPVCAWREHHGVELGILRSDADVARVRHTTKSSNRIAAQPIAPHRRVRHVAEPRENSFELSQFEGA